MSWFVYILECADRSLYTGITTDITRRIDEHNLGNTAAKYTRAKRPVKLVFKAPVENRSTATKVEIAIKKMTREEKLKLIAGGALPCQS